MSGKKKKKKTSGQPMPLVRLSQCMIVKNEEKNIEKALSWAKPVAFEQIVVDTGSTDRTVEIAEKAGAKVYHFEWISDFSAAKNYAIEQARGNWIAFLDADEFFAPVDAKKTMVHLRNVMLDPVAKKDCLAVRCKWSQVDEEGRPFAVFTQERIFRNLPEVRYIGKIHEKLNISNESVLMVNDITIIHTGYSTTAYEETGKRERNLDMLKAEMEKNPDDPNLKAYYADSLCVMGDEDSMEEALRLYREAVDSGDNLFDDLRKSSYLRLLQNGLNSGEDQPGTEALCRRALSDTPGDMDYEYILGMLKFNMGEFDEAWKVFLGVEGKLLNVKSLDAARLVTAKPTEFFGRMVLTAYHRNDADGLVRYATMVLAAEKTDKMTLGYLIAALLSRDVPEDDVFSLLGKLYNLDDPQDLLLIAKASKDIGAKELALKVVGMIKRSAT